MTADLFEARQVGRTRLRLPLFGLGTAHFGGMYEHVSGAQAEATLKAAWAGGVRYFDSAPYYGRGLSEHRLGSFLIDRPREDYLVTTKIGRVFFRPSKPGTFDRTPWNGGLNFDFRFDYSYDGVMRSYEQSLMRLCIDSVDALLVHDPDAALHEAEHGARMNDLTDGGIKALEELKRAGDIEAIGMGLNLPESFETIASLIDPDFLIVAMPYTLLSQSVLHTGLKRCRDKGISVVIGAPFASGILATGPGPNARYGYKIATEEIQAKTRRIQDVCRAYDVTLQSAALQFTLGHPAVVSIIPGAAKPEEVGQNLAFMRETIPTALWEALKSEDLIDPESPCPVQ
ncbi:MAG: aldo/keto reductase [Hyphomicrobiales bacterium]|nr:aldo/keto reductase [Hyphomicrobiales bacterium]